MNNLTHEQLVEKVSREICAVGKGDPDGRDKDMAEWFEDIYGQGSVKRGWKNWNLAEVAARAAIATIAEATKEPTEAMVGAAYEDGIGNNLARDAHRAMHAKSPLYPEGK